MVIKLKTIFITCVITTTITFGYLFNKGGCLLGALFREELSYFYVSGQARNHLYKVIDFL